MESGGATVKIKRIAAASAVVAAATAVILGCGGSDSGTQPADTVLRNGYVYTVDG